MKSKILTSLVLMAVLTISACSSSDGNNNLNSFLQGVGLAKSVKNTDQEVLNTYGKYKHLLNESEQQKAIKAYVDVKTALDDVDLASPLKYEIAKASYVDSMPIYIKYKDKIDHVGKRLFESNHQKLKTISETIESTKDNLVKDKQMKNYFDTVLILLGSYASSQN